MRQTLIVFVQDEPGVLNRVSSMIRKRNFNIVSLVAGRTEKSGITRMTIVLNKPDKTKQKVIVNNLKKLIDVYDVVDATDIECHIREYALIKIRVGENHDILNKITETGDCRILNKSSDIMILEISGDEQKVEGIINKLNEYEIIELMRSGKMAMVQGNEEDYKPKLVKSDPDWATKQLQQSF